MIVSWDDSWALVTPMKVGSTSVRTLLKRRFVQMRPKHRCDLYVEYKTARRMLLIRDPIRRFESMFWHAINTDHPLGSLSWEAFVDWVRLERLKHNVEAPWLPGKDYRVWSMRMVDYAQQWKPTEVYRLEDGLRRVCAACGVDEDPGHRKALFSRGRPDDWSAPFVPYDLLEEDIEFWKVNSPEKNVRS